MSSVTDVVEASVAHSARIVGVSRTGKAVEVIVLRSRCIGILEKSAQRSTCSTVLEYARHNVGHGIHSRCAAAKISSCHETSELLGVDILSRGEIIHSNAYSRSVSFAEHGHRYPIIPE